MGKAFPKGPWSLAIFGSRSLNEFALAVGDIIVSHCPSHAVAAKAACCTYTNTSNLLFKGLVTTDQYRSRKEGGEIHDMWKWNRFACLTGEIFLFSVSERQEIEN